MIAVIAPKCFGDPLGAIDPLARELWLSHVTEATPLFKFWTKKSSLVIVTALPALLGLCAALFESTRHEGLPRRRWLTVAGIIVVGSGQRGFGRCACSRQSCRLS